MAVLGNPPRDFFDLNDEPEMPETMPTLNVAAFLWMLFVFLAILTTWVCVVLRLAFGLPVFPARTPRYVPWGPGSVGLAVVGWLMLQVAVPVIYLRMAYPKIPGALGPRPELTPSEQMSLSAIINSLTLLLIPLMLYWLSGARRQDFGIAAKGFAQKVFQGMVAYPLLAPFVLGAMIAALLIWNKTNHPLEDAIKLDHSPGMLTVMVLAGVVFAPLAEELIFRGVLLGWLTRTVYGRPRIKLVESFVVETDPASFPNFANPAEPGFGDALDRDPENPYAAPSSKIELLAEDEFLDAPTTSSQTLLLILSNVIVSIVFAGLHSAVWPTPIPIFFLSLGLGFLYQRTGSLIPPMALHMTFNGVSTLLMILTLNSPAPKAKEVPKPPDATKKVEAKPTVAMINFNFFPERTH